MTSFIPACPTPFKEGKIDYQALEELIESLLLSGVQELLAIGSTGEVLLLSEEEQEKLVYFFREKTLNRAKLWVGIGRASTHESFKALDLSERARSDGHLIIAPYYVKPNDEGMEQHFKTLLERSSKPCILYNNPARVGTSISEKVLRRLSSHPRFLGLKDSDGSQSRLSCLQKLVHENSFKLYCGEDSDLLNFLEIGATGFISVSGNILAPLFQKILRGFTSHPELAKEQFQEILPLLNAMGPAGNPAAIKFLLSNYLRGFKDELRAPLTSVAVPLQTPLLEAFKQVSPSHKISPSISTPVH